jgi:hypothetical protein
VVIYLIVGQKASDSGRLEMGSLVRRGCCRGGVSQRGSQLMTDPRLRANLLTWKGDFYSYVKCQAFASGSKGWTS